MTAEIDILGLGCAAVDDLIYVDAFPCPDVKTQVRRSERQCGGLTATALVAAARLGARCAFAGVLGPSDELSQFVAQALAKEGIDLSHVVYRPDARPIHSRIVVGAEGHTRNIFFDIGGRSGADDSEPAADVILRSRVVFVDHLGVAGAIRAARIAREANIPVGGDLERDDMEGFGTLLELIDHLILSEDFALRLTHAGGPAQAIDKLWTSDRRMVAVTAGSRGCWWRDAHGAGIEHSPAFEVDVVDSTGCGDVFHGAYAAALAFGRAPRERIALASASAALKATRPGGQSGIPDLASVEEFLRGR